MYLPPGGAATKPPVLILLGRDYYHPLFGTELAAQGIAVAYIDLTDYGAPLNDPDVGRLRAIR